ncbi:MAG: hypothetical protein KC609_03740 [Myxococcales bacterium]|nr:hypothetical protein [Myxococcales bacterium]
MDHRTSAGERITALALALLTLFTLSRCTANGMSLSEATLAVEESALLSEASMVVNGTIEISTSFTIGQAVEEAAAEIRAFVASQLPCAKLTLVAATLTVEYGAQAGGCSYRGMTYSGTHTISVERNATGDVIVRHDWSKLSNGRISVSGTATVTWSIANGTRNVKHDLSWTRLADGRTAQGQGERTQSLLEGGIFEGIQLDGHDTFTTQRGTWTLDTNAVEVRWADPVPQSGSFEIEAPSGKRATLRFSRLDSTTISVSIKTGVLSFTLKVSSTGAISN